MAPIPAYPSSYNKASIYFKIKNVQNGKHLFSFICHLLLKISSIGELKTFTVGTVAAYLQYRNIIVAQVYT
jgi:hypothetical protein